MIANILLNQTEAPLPLIADMYNKVIVPSITEESTEAYDQLIDGLNYDYFKTNTEDKCPFMDWTNVKNRLLFTQGFVDIFQDGPQYAVWIAYEAINMFLLLYPSFYAPEMHVFNWNNQKFWIKYENEHVIFLTPEEY